MSLSRLFRIVVPAVLVLAGLSCSDSTGPDEPGPPAAAAIAKGDDQSGTAGSIAGDSLALVVKDADGRPVRGVVVTFSVTQGGGSLSATQDTTDAAGRVAVRWTLGPAAGEQRVSASVAGIANPVVFSAEVEPAAPAAITALGGAAQNGTVAGVAPDTLVARVTDQFGNAVGGVVVTWSASTGATLAPIGTTTGADGLVRARLTAGTASGTYTATASVAGLAPATFTLVAAAGPPASVVVQGGGQSASAGAPLGDSLVVLVFDQHANPVGDVAVAFSSAQGGSFSPATARTNATGRVATRWTLGGAVGTQVARIAVAGLDTASMAATASVPSGATLVKTEGDGGVVAVASTRTVTVQARTAGGQPLPGVTITWALDAPVPASQMPGASLSAASAMTDASGNASTTLTLSSMIGTNTVTASAPGIAAVAFTVTGRAGLAASIVKVAGDSQVGVAGQPLPDSLVIRLRDAFGNLVPGVMVTWTPSEGGGSIAAASTLTDAAGLSRVRWTVAAGTHAVSATAGSAGSVVFIGTGVVPVSYQLQYVRGSGNSGIAGTTLPETLVVRVVDDIGRVQAGVPVTFTAGRGGGSVAPASVPSDANGLARTLLTLGTRVDTNRVVASVPGPSTVELWNVSRPGPIALIEKVDGDGQEGPINQALPRLLQVRLMDRYGNATVRQGATWSGDGIIQPLTNADTNGLSLVRWTPTLEGTNTAVAHGGLATFTATGRRIGEIRMAKVSADSQRTAVGEFKSLALSVKLTDQAGVPLVGVKVGWGPRITSGGTARGFFIDTTLTDAAGVASAQYQVGTAARLSHVRYSAAGVPADSFAVITTALEPCNVNPWVRPSPQGANAMRTRVGQRFPMVMGSYASDRYLNPAAGASRLPAIPAGFTVTHHGSTITDSTGWSDTSTVVAGTTAGTFEVRADYYICSPGQRNQIAFWTFIVDPAAAATIAVGGGDGQTVTAGRAIPLFARVADVHGNQAPDSGITWSTPNGTITRLASGLATWTPDAALGGKTATATLPNGQSVSFEATVASSAIRVVSASADSAALDRGNYISYNVQLLASDGTPMVGVTPALASSDGTGSFNVLPSNSAGVVFLMYRNDIAGTRYLFVSVPGGNAHRLTATHR